MKKDMEFYTCDFCEEKTDLIVGFISANNYYSRELKLCFSCFEENTEKKTTDLEYQKWMKEKYNNCMYCGIVCWENGNTKECAIEVSHRFVQYRICKKCWKEQRDL